METFPETEVVAYNRSPSHSTPPTVPPPQLLLLIGTHHLLKLKINRSPDSAQRPASPEKQSIQVADCLLGEGLGGVRVLVGGYLGQQGVSSSPALTVPGCPLNSLQWGKSPYHACERKVARNTSEKGRQKPGSDWQRGHRALKKAEAGCPSRTPVRGVCGKNVCRSPAAPMASPSSRTRRIHSLAYYALHLQEVPTPKPDEAPQGHQQIGGHPRMKPQASQSL